MDLPARLPKTYLRLSTLDLSQGGRFARVRENVVKSGHVVGLGSPLVLNPSVESELIGYVDNSGHLRIKGCRFAHGAGFKRFFRLQCTSLTRADKVDLPARIHESKGVSAHLGTVAERHTEKNASLSLDLREQGRFCKLLKFMYPLPCTHPHEYRIRGISCGKRLRGQSR